MPTTTLEKFLSKLYGRAMDKFGKYNLTPVDYAELNAYAEKMAARFEQMKASQ